MLEKCRDLEAHHVHDQELIAYLIARLQKLENVTKHLTEVRIAVPKKYLDKL